MKHNPIQFPDGCPEKLYKPEGFYRQKLGGARTLLAKEEKGLFQARPHPGVGGEGGEGCYHAGYPDSVDNSSLKGLRSIPGRN